MRHIIGILLQNESGALSRVAAMFSSRGYNIESLSVSATDDSAVSRITLVTKGSDAVVQQITKQLHKLIDVVAVDDMTSDDHVERELALIKIRVRPAQREAVQALLSQAGGRVLTEERDCQIVELTWQLTDRAGPRQVPNAKVALGQVIGAGEGCGISILTKYE